jgi:hypothetical protein
LFASVLWWVLWVGLGYTLGKNKGQETSGAVWCFVLGPFGLLVLAALPNLQEAKQHEVGGYQRIEEEERRMRDRIEREERIRAGVRRRVGKMSTDQM